eukprot:gene10683-18058_t
MGCGSSKKVNVEAQIESKKCLLIIDMQNDFITGSLMVGGAADILGPVNECREKNEWDVVAHTIDSHPADHCSFVDNHEGAEMFATKMISTPDGSDEMEQVDSYSGFFDNYKDRATGLGDELVKRGVTDVFVCGLAYDYCAGSSACDAAELGFKTYLIEDLTKAVSPETAKQMQASLKKAGVITIQAADVASHFAPKSEEEEQAHRMSFGGVVGVRLATYSALLEARAAVVKMDAVDPQEVIRAYSEVARTGPDM